MYQSQMQEPASQAVGEDYRPQSAQSRMDAWFRSHSDLVALLAVAAGFLLRVRAAAGTFLNPDEALHFSVANQTSLPAAYRASLTLAHPPLLIFLLYFWRHVGTSEFVLRLPSVILGTAFCWIFFKWVQGLVGSTAGLTGLIFVALLPPIAALSSEVRQYSLLLFFIAMAAFLLERALAKNSAALMAMSSICVWAGMLSHYSGPLFAAAFGIYSALCLMQRRLTRTVMATWAAGQLGVFAAVVFLYRTQISRLKGSAMAEQAINEWLRRSYFHPGYDNLVSFVVGRSFAVFQFIFGQHVIGDIAGLFFLAGVGLLLSRRRIREQVATTPWLLAIFLVSPFAINCALAVTGRYPYGGTRHSVFLAMFAFAGIGYFFAAVTRQRTPIAVATAAIIVAVCYAFGFHHQPYMTRDDQSSARMNKAIQFIRSQIPPADPILMDYQTSLMLGHYLCVQQSSMRISGAGLGANDFLGPRTEVIPALMPTFQVLHCGDHSLVLSPAREWMFAPETFPRSWDEFVAQNALKPGSDVWVVQAGWGVGIAPELQHKRSDIAPADIQLFGKNISMFKLTVAQKTIGFSSDSR